VVNRGAARRRPVHTACSTKQKHCEPGTHTTHDTHARE
jgi:hypothetical protein